MSTLSRPVLEHHRMSDRWLDRWLPLIASKVGHDPILELGCGAGRDTEVLVGAGHRVIGIDLSESAVAQARARLPACEFHCQDFRAPFPPSASHLNVALASLSLHYFCWSETLGLAQRLHQLLRPAGLLLCRLNSTQDHYFGASGYQPIEPDFYLVNGEPKRFFDRAAAEALFADGWKIMHIEHQIVQRYAHPKALWEVIVERVA